MLAEDINLEESQSESTSKSYSFSKNEDPEIIKPLLPPLSKSQSDAPNDNQSATDSRLKRQFSQLQKGTNEVIGAIRVNVEKIYERHDKLYDLDKSMESLHEASEKYQRNTKKLADQYYNDNAKWKLILVAVFLVTILVIIIGTIIFVI